MCSTLKEICFFLFFLFYGCFHEHTFFFFNLALQVRRPDIPNSSYKLFLPVHLKTCFLLTSLTRMQLWLAWGLYPVHLFLNSIDLVDFSSTHSLREVLPRDLVLFPASLYFLSIRESLHAQIFISFRRQMVLEIACRLYSSDVRLLTSKAFIVLHLPELSPKWENQGRCFLTLLDTEVLRNIFLGSLYQCKFHWI